MICAGRMTTEAPWRQCAVKCRVATVSFYVTNIIALVIYWLWFSQNPRQRSQSSLSSRRRLRPGLVNSQELLQVMGCLLHFNHGLLWSSLNINIWRPKSCSTSNEDVPHALCDGIIPPRLGVFDLSWLLLSSWGRYLLQWNDAALS